MCFPYKELFLYFLHSNIFYLKTNTHTRQPLQEETLALGGDDSGQAGRIRYHPVGICPFQRKPLPVAWVMSVFSGWHRKPDGCGGRAVTNSAASQCGHFCSFCTVCREIISIISIPSWIFGLTSSIIPFVIKWERETRWSPCQILFSSQIHTALFSK